MIETSKGLICPGWCGYVVDGTKPGLFTLHVAACPNAQRTLELMRQYTEWLLDNVVDLNYTTEQHLMTHGEIARVIVEQFRDQIPPKVMMREKASSGPG